MRIIKSIKELDSDKFYLIKVKKTNSKSWIVTKLEKVDITKDAKIERLALCKDVFKGIHEDFEDGTSVVDEENKKINQMIGLTIFFMFIPIIFLFVLYSLVKIKPMLDIDEFVCKDAMNYKSGKEYLDLTMNSVEMFKMINEKRVFELEQKEAIIHQL